MPSGQAKTKRSTGGLMDIVLRPGDRIGGPARGRGEPGRHRSSDAAPAKKSRKKKRGSGRGKITIGKIFYWLAVLALWGIVAAIGLLIWIGVHLPPIQSLEIPKRPPSVLILGTGGTTLATRGEGGAEMQLRDLPDYAPNAFIAIEDRRFYSHYGVDPFGILRAVVRDVLHRGAAQGGSTLTQQLAKNLFLTQQRTMSRKLQEAVLALWLEHKFTKAQILDLYLNRVYFGSGAYGIEAAAQRYFGKSARQLTVAEAAMLAGLVQSPTRLAPNRNPEGATRRAALVVNAMAEQKMISEDAARRALANPAHAIKASGGGSANYVADWVMDAIDDLIGPVEQDITVDTTIDPALQTAAEQSLDDALAQKGERLNISQGALVAMTPDGVVRALVGGRNYADSQYNRAIDAKRQPGSSFKPFVYLTALEHGLTPDTIREDAPISVKGWKPENYEREYLGPVTLTQALANSLNTVSVRLTLELGPNAVTRTAYRLGIGSKLEPNASIALGTSEVSVLEMVSAYATFANGGYAISPHVVERIRGAEGKVLYARAPQNLGRIVDPRYIGMMNTMMHETLVSGTARHADLPGWLAAGKTGTTEDFRDAWFIGYTGHMVAGIWLGNDDNSPTKKVTGGALPVDIWSRFMRVAHQGVTPVPLPGFSSGWLGSAPTPPQPVDGGPANTPPNNQRDDSGSGGSLDSWLLNKLFGRH